ncbi:MAG TPA: cation:proton antiporter [Methanocellaceae archaeon]
MSPDDMVIFFLQVAVMLFTALLFGQFMRRLHFPAVIGELIGGIILGPTIWGWLSPGTQLWLFPVSGPAFMGRDALVQVCMLFFLFAAGLEMNLGVIHKHRLTIAWTSLMGVLIPFIMGIGLVLLFPGLWGSHVQGNLTLFALFMGTALSISALPVIARILMDLNLMKSEVGMIVMGAATVNDLIGWSLFALILSSFAPQSVLHLPAYVTFVLVLLIFVLMITAGRIVGGKAQDWLKARLPWPGAFLGLTIVFVLLMAALMELIGVHAVFGAFLVGMVLSQNLDKRNEAHEMVYQFVMYFFAPLYFVSIGLRTNFFQSFDPVLVLVVLAVACVGKVVGATLGARIGRLRMRQATAIGFAMNARGAMELIMATVARDAGLIDDRIFVALILMALFTTLLSSPMIDRLIIHKPEKTEFIPHEPYKRMADFEDPVEEE